jgi:hypothetical protein
MNFPVLEEVVGEISAQNERHRGDRWNLGVLQGRFSPRLGCLGACDGVLSGHPLQPVFVFRMCQQQPRTQQLLQRMSPLKAIHVAGLK